jgi:uncharacterized protein with NRDE domain
MCIVVFRWSPESESPLHLIANRDEFFVRPAAPMQWWDGGDVLAGRDLKGGGTWLGITKRGRFAALTNIRNPALRKTKAPSRGALVSDFLSGDASAAAYLKHIAERADAYEGFNLLCGELSVAANKTSSNLWFFNSQEGIPRALSAGVYGISNATLDTPWPKLERLKQRFNERIGLNPSDSGAIQASLRPSVDLEALLLDAKTFDDAVLPSTGVPIEWERALSAVFIRHESYGTRASTTIHVNKTVARLTEITHTQIDQGAGRADFEFSLIA